MRRFFEDVGIVGGILFLLIFLFAFVVVFVATPRIFYAESKCLAAGYPRSHVTWNMQIYCIGKDGAVVDRIERLR